MRLSIFCILLVCLMPQTSQSCTTFSLSHNGQLVFGKSYDWFLERGLVIINKRGVSKAAMADRIGEHGPYASWTSKHPNPDSRPATGSLQSIQYQLENHSKVEEVISSHSQLRIDPTEGPGIRYLVLDMSVNLSGDATNSLYDYTQ